MLKTVSPLSNAIGALVYKGTWNASANTPTLTSGVGNKGDYYYVSVAGTTNLDGITDWQVGDLALFNGTVWQKIDNTDAVQSVNGKTGVVVLNANDVGATANTTYVLAGTGLSGGGRLNGNVTLTVGTVPVANVSGAVPNTVNIIAGTGLIGGGPLTGNVTLIASGIPAANIAGLGSMATQNANAVSITGGSINGTAIGGSAAGDGTFDILTSNVSRSGTYLANASISAASAAGAFSYGSLSYSDTGIVASFANATNSAVQMVIQNSSSSSNASTDIVVVNDTGAAYGDFGITSSTVAGTGRFYTANSVYLYSGSADLYFGTISNNAVHFTANNATTDAMVLNANNTVTINAYSGTSAATATFGTASLPLVPLGYLIISINGTNRKIPYYAV